MRTHRPISRPSRVAPAAGALLLLCTTGCAPGEGDGDDAPGAVDRRSAAIQAGSNDTASPLNDAVVGLVTPGWCSATLITADWALTAAHCVRDGWTPTNGRVRIGVNSAAFVDVSTDQCFMHPSAFPTGSATPWRCGTAPGSLWQSVPHDLALVHLASPVSRSVVRPMRVQLANPRPSYAAWIGQAVTLRGWGAAGPYGGPFNQPALRQVGLNNLDSVGPDLAWVADRSNPGGAGTALLLGGDSGGPLIYYPSASAPTILGTASGTNSTASGAELSYWSNATLPAAGAWINSVMTLGTDASAQVTAGSVTPPATGWRGEGADGVDNCPYAFNPWQSDLDGDGVGDECDVAPPSGGWGAAQVSAAGALLSGYNSTGAAVTAAGAGTGSYTVTLRQLGASGGNVQVVATGTSPVRCKVAGWYPTGAGAQDLQLNVRCHDYTGAAAASSFIAYASFGASPQQGAYLYYDGFSTWGSYAYNSTGGTNAVTPLATGKYLVSFPGLSTGNYAVHVTAYGTGSEHCKIDSWGSASAYVSCYSGAAPVNSAFSFMVSTGATRSGLVGGHAWVSGPTSAPGSYQLVQTAAIGGSATATVSGYSAVTYPSTAVQPQLPLFPLTTAYGASDASYCKIASFAPAGTGTVVSTTCFTPAGGPNNPVNFTQSFLAARAPN